MEEINNNSGNNNNNNELPQISKYFKDENLCMQDVYRAKEDYNVIYINPNLYEEIFNEEYNWNDAKKKISDMFSITLDEKKGQYKLNQKAYSDKQYDPLNLALSGNLGSGRAYFFEKIFNIKGDKTKLAVSPKAIYSNGKYALSAGIKETVIANILSKDFIIPSFESLAILVTNERFDFEEEYLDSDDVLRVDTYNLPCCIEVRVSRDLELYRISNSLENQDDFFRREENIEDLCDRIANIEANKFIDRFLHRILVCWKYFCKRKFN